MPFQIKPPVEKEFFLVKTDKEFGDEEGATKISVRQAATGEVTSRNNLFTDFKRTYEVDGDITVTQHISFDDIKRYEVYLTLSACNIIGLDGNPLFTFNKGRLKDEAAFKIAWDLLPVTASREIHSKVLDMNPQWPREGDEIEMGEDE